jgi:hypothetical protein
MLRGQDEKLDRPGEFLDMSRYEYILSLARYNIAEVAAEYYSNP